jgi:N6-adenosine-specific RNA methylase IME4
MKGCGHILRCACAAGPFRVVVADPAWKFGDSLPGATRGAAKQYDVMTAGDICRLALPPIADDAHLFLWRVSSMPQEALDVIAAWGFKVKSEMVWVKKTKHGKPHFGMGRHVRLGHEVCHIATRGKGAGILNRSQRSVFTSELDLDDDGNGTFEAAVGRHSEKPAEFYDIVRDLVPGPRVELFARQAREGFTVIGNQVPGNATTMVVAR